MNLVFASENILSSLRNYLEQVDDSDYHKPIAALSDSTLGQHTRHVIEFFQCLLEQSGEGTINYDKRKRDLSIEQSPKAAIKAIEDISLELPLRRINSHLLLEVSFEKNSDEFDIMETSFERELSYTIEHAIHHMAIIKIGLKMIAPGITVPDDFGVAPSTIKYRNGLCAQ